MFSMSIKSDSCDGNLGLERGTRSGEVNIMKKHFLVSEQNNGLIPIYLHDVEAGQLPMPSTVWN